MPELAMHNRARTANPVLSRSAQFDGYRLVRVQTNTCVTVIPVRDGDTPEAAFERDHGKHSVLMEVLEDVES